MIGLGVCAILSVFCLEIAVRTSISVLSCNLQKSSFQFTEIPIGLAAKKVFQKSEDHKIHSSEKRRFMVDLRKFIFP